MPINERDIFWDWDAACHRQDVHSQQELARYVLEDLDEVARIFHNAKSYLNDHAFYAYASNDPPRRAREEVKALYECLQNGKPKAGGDYLAYVLEDVKSVRVKGKQRIRLARGVLFWGHGVCLDWVLLFAACVFKAHIYPLIIVTQEHALLGYWLTESDANKLGQVILSGADVREHFSKERIKVINATRIPPDERGKLMPFEDAESEAETHLPYALFAVDICAARKAGIKSLLPLEPWPGNHSLPRAEHFQERPEFEDIRKWWRDENTYGVLALVGIGGAGKTALAHRFLAQLPESGIQEAVEKDETLPIPDALFVWSFYQHPDVDRCSTELYNYLTGEQAPKATFEQVQGVLSRSWRGCRVLLVFDGVEKLQIAPGIEPEEEGGVFGQFLPEGTPLARFLSWCCDGPWPIRVLVTSRFSLTDLQRYESAGGYRTVDLGDLPLESARALLQAYGVKGLDWQLDELIQEFGNHAQTLDLLGNALRIGCDGDPAQISKLPSLEDVKRLPGIRDKVWGRVRVLRFYEEILPPEELAVLQWLCLFKVIPVTARLLAGIFGASTALPQQDFESRLKSLDIEYKLVYSHYLKDGVRHCAVHPSVRSYFYNRLLQQERIALHERVRRHLASLFPSPLTSLAIGIHFFPWVRRNAKPIDQRNIDLFEELIYHTIHAGRREEALILYEQCSEPGLPTVCFLGGKLGEYARGARIVKELLAKGDSNQFGVAPELDQEQAGALLNDQGLYWLDLGSLEGAKRHLEQGLKVIKQVASSEPEMIVSLLLNSSELQVKLGRLPAALDRANQAVTTLESTYKRPPFGAMCAFGYRAHAYGLRGEISSADKEWGGWYIGAKYHDLHGTPDVQSELWWGNLLIRCGCFGEAEKLLNQIKHLCEAEDLRHYTVRCNLLVAELTRLQGKSGEIPELLDRALAWGVQTADQEVLVWGNLIHARLALDAGELDEAERAIREGLRIAEYCGYGLYWIDLQVAKGQWELARGRQLQEGKKFPPKLEIWTPPQWFERAEASALRALNGQLKDSDEPALRPDLPEDQLAMLGARHSECGYAWGEGDALHLVGEARLELAQCVGPAGHDSEGYKQLLEKACQAAEEALALRQRIQDPKARHTEALLARLRREYEAG